MTFTAKANQYVEAVLKGELPTCKQIRQACQRTAEHFAKQSDQGFPYYYDEAQAERVCKIIQSFRHVKGKWAAQRKRIILEPWQCWIVCSLYGWRRKADRTRKYRRATLIIPRKQGKSLLAAALLLYHLLFDGEFGAECYCGASNLNQAKEIFSAAQQMLIQEPSLREHTSAEVNASSIVVPDTNSKAMPVIGRPKDGSNVSFAVLDETHQCKDLSLYESFQTGTGAREQPLVISVSTSGFGTENPCRELQRQAEKVLEGSNEDEELFIAIFTIDDGIDWKSDEALLMANPNAGVSVTMDYLRGQRQNAINNPEKYASFATKHLDVTVAAEKAYYSLEKWRACTDAVKLEDFEGEECWMAIDLSNKLDLTAIATVFHKVIDDQDHYYAFVDCFAPEEAITNNTVYSQWSARSLIHVCDGNVIDKNDLLELITGYSERFLVREIAFDPFNSAFIEQDIAKLLPQIQLVEVLQRATHLHNPMKLLQELTYTRRIHHNGDPVLTYGISNVVPHRHGKLMQPGQEKDEYKIDPAVALIMALARASVATEQANSFGFMFV